MSWSRLWSRVVGRVRGARAPIEEEIAGEEPSDRDAEIDVRIEADLFAAVRQHVEDFTRGEEAGFLICSINEQKDRIALLARAWYPIPEREIERNAHGSVLSWSAQFNGEMVQRAIDMNGTLVLVHSHGRGRPRFSPDDRQKEAPLFAPASRLLEPLVTGSVLIGAGHAIGSFWRAGRRDGSLRRLVILGETIESWRAQPLPERVRRRLDRLAPVIGPEGDAKLADARVAVIGISGGGSHVVQQLAHQGVGTLIPVDDETLDETNLGRVVGATYHDIDVTKKTDLAERVAASVDPDIDVVKVEQRFPSPQAIEALKTADVVVSCVDEFRDREAINLFCRRYMIPLVDIGMTITTVSERLARAEGQLIVAIPGRPCLRCWHLTDAILRREQEERPAGYDRNPDASGDPQVVSMNGVLASEACNCVLDLITGYSGGARGARWWFYEGRSGQLERIDLPSHRASCPACAEQRLGDPL